MDGAARYIVRWDGCEGSRQELRFGHEEDAQPEAAALRAGRDFVEIVREESENAPKTGAFFVYRSNALRRMGGAPDGQ